MRKSTAHFGLTIDEQDGFYFVMVTLVTVNLNFIGVQIDYRSSCPPL